MPIKVYSSNPEQIAKEVETNMSREDSARIFILGTKMPDGYTMRLGLKHPEAIAGILYHHAIVMGNVNEAVAMAEELIRVGMTAKAMIKQEASKRAKQN